MPISEFRVPDEVTELLAVSPRVGADAVVYFYNGDWVESASRLTANVRVTSSRQGRAAKLEVSPEAHDVRLLVVQLYGNLLNTKQSEDPFSVSCQQEYRVQGQAEIVELHIAVNDIPIDVENKSYFDIFGGGSVAYGQTFWVGDEAKVKNRIESRLPEKAAFNGLTLSIGATLMQNEMDVDLAGVNSECQLRSLLLATREQRIETVSNIRHLSGETKSVQLIKSVVNEHAKVAFTGNVQIASGAQKSDARQLSQSLLLSREGEAITKPQLDVGADDVTATHGATVGQLDEAQLFYLMSRGFNRSDARHMLTLAYQRDVFDQLKSGFVKTFMERIHARLPVEFSAENSRSGGVMRQ